MVVMTSQRTIRVRYAGTVNFASRLASTFTGLIFVTFISRRLSEEEFGLWSFFGVWLQYFIIPSGFVNYWSIRYMSRGFRVGKTSLILNSILMFASIFIFLAISNYVLYSEISLEYLSLIIMVLTLQIPAEYLSSTLDALTTATFPEFIGYGGFIMEIVKLISGFILVVYYRFGLVGALLSYVIAKYIYVLFLFLILRNELNDGFNWSIASKWIKLSWLPAYNMASGYIRSLETPIISLFIQFSDPSMPFRALAHLKAVNTICSVISYSGLLSFALYPKILSGGSREDVESTLKYVLMFAIPMIAGVIVMSESFLSLLRTEYAVSYQALYLGAIGVLPSLISGIASSAVTGLERVDLLSESNFRDYFKSKLFTYPSISLVLNIIYIITIYIIFNGLSTVGDPTFIVLIWILISFFFNIILCLKFYFDVKSIMGVRFPWSNIIRYVIASMVMFIVLWFSGFGRIVSQHFLEVLKYSILGVFSGAFVYGLILFLWDPDFKSLMNYSISWIRNKFLMK
ncbi:MAG: hypothetical protein QXM35_03170 [Candidatus Methanomethylicia archaeon]